MRYKLSTCQTRHKLSPVNLSIFKAPILATNSGERIKLHLYQGDIVSKGGIYPVEKRSPGPDNDAREQRGTLDLRPQARIIRTLAEGREVYFTERSSGERDGQRTDLPVFLCPSRNQSADRPFLIRIAALCIAVYTTLRHVARTAMSGVIGGGNPVRPTQDCAPTTRPHTRE